MRISAKNWLAMSEVERYMAIYQRFVSCNKKY
jgi:hypothetical protein